jgi:hypothetical protein
VKKEKKAKVGKWKALRALTAVLGNFAKTLGLDRDGLCRVLIFEIDCCETAFEWEMG